MATPTADGLYAVFDTNKGTFTAELYYEKAPLSCANMVGLAEGTIAHYQPGSSTPSYSEYYKSFKFHRIIDGFVIQGGDPTGTGTGGPGYRWPDEVRPDLTHETEGVLSMANSGPNTNGSQFFITLAPTPSLNGIHNAFGKVVEGIEIVRAIGKTPTNANDAPTTPVILNQLEILRIGDAANAFDPTFYANHFDPTISIFGEFTATKPQIQATDDGEFTVFTPFAPLTEYHVFTSNDLENWEQIQYIAPSLAPDTEAPSALLTPASEGGPKFAAIDAYKRSSSDVSGIVEKIQIQTKLNGINYTETIKIRPELIGTYTINESSEITVYVDWIEISETRTLLWIQVPTNNPYQPIANSAQFYLDRSNGDQGSVYLRNQNYSPSDPRDDIILEGTFTITRVQE